MAPPCLSSLDSRITRHSTLIALVLVAVATLFSVACSHAADAPSKTGAGRTVRAGIFNFKPLVIFDQESPPTGFIVDILNHIAKQEEWNVEYVPGNWQVSLERLRTDKIDIILCIGYSAERDEYLDFPKEHVLLDWGLLYRGKGSSINTILDVEGKTIATMKASIYTEGFKNTLDQFNIKAKIVEKTEVKDVFGALESGEVDAAISSTVAGIPFESSQKVDRSPVVFTPVKLGFAVNSGKNADLTAAIDKRLAELKSDKNSYYYHKLDEWVTARSHTIPKMFYWIIGGISGALIVFIVFVIILKLQVKAKTNSLKVELEQRKRTEAELIASVEDLRDSQSIAHVGSWRLDFASNQVVWSEELYKMYGFDPKLPPPPYTEHQKLFTPESWERLSAALQNTKNTGIPYNLELKTLRPDGSSGWMWVRGMSVLDADGAFVGLRGMAQDITERKKAEEEKIYLEAQLQQAHKMEAIGTMAGGIAHDFNNLLAIIIGNIDIVQHKQNSGTSAEENVEHIKDAANRAKNLVTQILTFGRQNKPELVSIDLVKTITEFLKLLRSTTPVTIEIMTTFADESIVVNADATQFQQVILNLSSNAAHAMDDKGLLKVAIGKVEVASADIPKAGNLDPGPYAKISVSDTGTGMDKQTLERIFDPFFTTKEVGVGTGMGLSVIHGIVVQHGGFITVDSTVGAGSTFNIFLPVINQNVGIKQIDKEPPLPTGTERILFVDDEESIAYTCNELLEYQGYQVTSVTSGIEALDLFKANPDAFDLVFTDQTMPVMTGAELATELLKIRPDLPIILCSGYSAKVSDQDAKGIGIREFCMKPMDMKQLAIVTRRVLDE